MKELHLSCYLCGGSLTSDEETYLGICQLCNEQQLSRLQQYMGGYDINSPLTLSRET